MNYYLLHSIVFCALVSTQNLVAQSVIESKYENGQIQTRYHIREKDTFCIENFYRNGSLESKSWHNDSVFRMESNQMFHKQYGHAQKATWLNAILYLEGSDSDYRDFRDSLLEFYPNGQCKSKSYYVHNERFTQYHYLPTGELEEFIESSKNKDNTFQRLHRKLDIEQMGLLDTTQQTYTLTFKQRNQIRQQNIYQWIPKKANDYFPILTQMVYDTVGKRIAVWHRDSVLHPDKNNNLCLYGLRNAADEWVIPPQYESIAKPYYSTNNNINKFNTYFVVNQGNKKGVMNEKGEIVIPIEWDGLNDLSRDHKEIMEPLFREMLNWEHPHSEILFTAFKNKLCGVVNVFGEIILKPVYQSINQVNNDLFKIEVAARHGIVGKNGQIIVEPNYYELEFTKYDDLFIQTDTVFDPNQQQIVQKKGLINRFGKILLPCQFEDIVEADTSHRYFFTYLKEGQIQGFFHAERGWILDTSIYMDWLKAYNPVKSYHLVYKKVVYSNNRKAPSRYGVFDAPNADMLLPFEYQEIKYFEINEYHSNKGVFEKYPYFLCQKKGKYGIFDPTRRTWKLPLKYDDLHFLGDSLFLGLAAGKWWAIHGREHLLLSESVDDILFYEESRLFELSAFCIQKKNTLYRYNNQSFPYSASFESGFYNNRTRIFFNWRGEPLVANINGRVIASIEDRVLLQNMGYQTIIDSEKEGSGISFQEQDYYIVQNKKTNFQQIIDKQGNKKPFLSQYEIQNFQPAFNLALVADKKRDI